MVQNKLTDRRIESSKTLASAVKNIYFEVKTTILKIFYRLKYYI
jgi:hypothetical protein